jgi:hypothetical protein
LPDASRSIAIDGDPSLVDTNFGGSVVGLGRYFSDGLGTTMVVGAPGAISSAPSGRITAFRWLASGGGTVGGSQTQVLTTSMGVSGFGGTLANLGSPTGGLPLLGIGNSSDNSTVGPSPVGTVFVQTGDAATGPFGARTVLYGVSNVGRVIFGGGLSGTNANLSVIGGSTDSVPDIGVAGFTSGIHILSGSKMLGAGPVNVTTAADVIVPVPAGWTGANTGAGGLVPDVNGDGLTDFAAADVFDNSGRVVVFW